MAAGRKTAATSKGLPVEELAGAPWFKLSYYGDMARLTERQWYAAIGCRLAVQRSLPTSPTPQSEAIARAEGSHWNALSHSPVTGNGAVLTVTPQTKGLGQTVGAGLVVKVGPLSDSTVELLRQRSKDENFGLFAIALNGPDQDIKAEFDATLKALRAGRPRRRLLTQSKVRHWAVCRVLPYIDIKLYERATGIRYPATVIRNALFPSARESGFTSHKATQEIAQSTAKFARQLLDESRFARMSASLEQS